jgi:polyisoprenoid-binding protein YceI
MTAKVSLNESNYSLSTFEGTVTVKSVTTDNNTRDRHIVEKTEFFNAKKYPTITMKAVKIASQPTNGSYKVDWLLTIKGITKKVTTDVLIAPMGNAMYLLTVFKINRLDWKLGPRSITMANDVYITLNTNVTK